MFRNRFLPHYKSTVSIINNTIGLKLNLEKTQGVKKSKQSFHSNSIKMKVFTQKRNSITGKIEWDVQHEDYDYHQEIARSAFADMLHDTERNKKYHSALQLAISKMHAAGKKANVLDIGTGTGLLAMMAVKCGADSVVACEAFAPMADCCRRILLKNGVADKITLIPKKSTDLKVGENGDLKEKANILVTEVFDTELIGEEALPTFSHAHEHLLEEDCIVVPDSAVIYAQVVECPTLVKCHKLDDLVGDDLQVILKNPQKMKECPGPSNVFDIQLSQMPRQSFREISEPLPVFYFDWSGRTPIIMKRAVRQQFTAVNSGRAQIVFLWWELNMDTEGKILLSCAPWWCHPDANLSSERPQETIPWRDHWMQAVYYIPHDIFVEKGKDITLVSSHDTFEHWFYIEDENNKRESYPKPVCKCGVHTILSRTNISNLNDERRSKTYLAQFKEEINSSSVVLDLNGTNFLGLACAKLGAKKVFVIEELNYTIRILEDYIKENNIDNVIILPQVNDDLLQEVTHVLCNPNFATAILPWEHLKIAYSLHKFKGKLKENVNILPEIVEFWAMPVEFMDLQKISIPLETCEGINMSLFDELVGKSREICDPEIEPQPLWEYPCKCRGQAQKLVEIDMRQLEQTYASDGTTQMLPSETEESFPVNGFALWSVWRVGGNPISCGPITPPAVGETVEWDPHTKQAVQIFNRTHKVNWKDTWSYQVACDLEKGEFNVALKLNAYT